MDEDQHERQERLLLKQLKATLPSVPELKELPPVPRNSTTAANLDGPSVGFFDPTTGWKPGVPDTHLPAGRQRKRAQAELFRHFTLKGMDLYECTGSCTKPAFEKEEKALNNIESEAYNNFAGTDSFLFKTVKAALVIDNIMVNCHNLYREGRRLQIPPRDEERAAAEDRERASRARTEKAVEDLERLQRLTQGAVETANRKLVRLQENNKVGSKAVCNQITVVQHLERFATDRAGALRDEFSLAAPEMPGRKPFYAELDEKGRCDFWKERLLKDDILMTAYDWFATSVHIA